MTPKPKKRPRAAKKVGRFARQFHSTEFVEWMQAKPCCTCTPDCGTLSNCWLQGERQRVFVDRDGYGIPHGPWIEVSHVKSRGAGGTWRDTIPQCAACHAEFHQKGRATFCSSRGWPLERLSELAAGYAAEWESRTRIADSEGECEILCGDL